MKKNIFPASILSVSLLFAGCQSTNETGNQSEKASKEGKLEIVTSFYPMYEFTKEIAGDNANVTLLTPSSVEPHDWEPAAKDLEEIQNADALVFNNENMETWIDDIEETVNTEDLTIIDASQGIELLPFSAEEHEHEGEEHSHDGESHDHEDHDHHHEFDPHLWLSPKMAIKEVETIANNLMQIDPDNKKVYEENKNSYIEKLKELDQKFEDALGNVKNKEIITQHAAFGYLADSYGLTQVPIAGLSPDAEPSAQQLKELKEFAKEHSINTIFFEENASSKVAETLANELNAKTAVLNTLEGLSVEDQEKNATYLSIMEENLKVLQEALK